MRRRTLAAHAVVVALGLAPRSAAAAPVWVGDMETADLSQWSYLLNPMINGMTYAQVTNEEVVQGLWAARIELHDDAVWPNGLRRVEMQHSPAMGRTAEGETLFFAWSFYLPETLSADPSQQIGYWESQNSYQQMMAFEVLGERMTFSTRRPMNVVQWDQDGVATAGEWHRIALRILWSKDPGVGEVDVWFDGEQVVFAAAAQTLADDNHHFTQLGLLRGDLDFNDVPVILIDDAVEGDNLEDVHPDLPADPGTTSDGGTTEGTTSDGGTTAGESDSNSGTTGATTTTSSGTSDATTTSSTGASTTETSDSGASTGATTSTTTSDSSASTGASDPDGDGSGCACRTRGGGPGALGLAVFLAFAAGRRRRGRGDAAS